MSLREKTRETVERGKEERGNFTPKADSVPARLYRYWLKESRSTRAREVRYGETRENFCHYWRVVAIWAPLMGIRRTIVNNADIIAGIFGIAAIIGLVLALIFVDQFWLVALTGIGIVAAIVAGSIAIVAAAYGIGGLFRKHAPNFTGKVKAIFTSPKFWVGFLGLAFAALVVATSWGTGFTGPIVWASILGGAAIIFFGFVFISDYLEGREIQRQSEWDELPYEDQLAIREYLAATPPARKPGKVELKVRAFFGGIRDFVVLITQVVRVNKWKICPLVEIPEEVK